MPKFALVHNIMKNAKDGFNAVTKNVKFITADKGNCTATMKIDKEHTNILLGLHGGFAATLIDDVSTFGLLSHDEGLKPNVSVNLNVLYIKGGKIGEELLIESRAVKVGKSLAFLEVDIFNKETMELLIKGNHTKYFLPEKLKK